MRRSLQALGGMLSAIAVCGAAVVVIPGTADAAGSRGAGAGWRFPYGNDACYPEAHCHEAWGEFHADPGGTDWHGYSGNYPGDAVRACDNEPDGKGVRAKITWESNSPPHNRSRVATTQGHASPYCTSWKTGNIAEGKRIHLKVCLVRGDQVFRCKEANGVA